MAEFKTLEVAGWGPAITGMRNPLKSWDKSDSHYENENFILGAKDHELAKKLCLAGEEHCKFLRQVSVWVDITAPAYWWSEFDTYKVGTTANSTSTMHTLYKDELGWKCFEMPTELDKDCRKAFEDYIMLLSGLVQYRLNTSKTSEEKNQYLQTLKAMLPQSFMYTRTVNLNYAVLKNMYNQRKNHRLPQWSKDFVSWVKTLPYSEFITLEFDN